MRKGKNVYQYIWQKELQPGESFEIEVKTNYLLPVGCLAALIFIVVILTITLKQKVIVRKRALRVQTKGGEYALKIIVTIKGTKLYYFLKRCLNETIENRTLIYF